MVYCEVKCNHCNELFKIKDTITTIVVPYIGSRFISCPKCHRDICLAKWNPIKGQEDVFYKFVDTDEIKENK